MARHWKSITAILCAYGLFKEFRPSEPFLTEYLESEKFVNLTDLEVNHEVYPVWVYSYLILLVPVFLLTDLVKYKPVILMEAIAYVSCWILLIVGKGVASFQLMEFIYGIATATEVAYYTYIYAAVPKDQYQRVTSLVRAAILVGRFLSGLVAQITVSTNLLNYYELNFVSLGSVYICMFFSNALPTPEYSIYFHRNSECQSQEKQSQDERPHLEDVKENNQIKNKRAKFAEVMTKMLLSLKSTLKDKEVIKWCIWWAIATSANILVGNNIQPLWEQIYPSEDKSTNIYNGVVAAAYTLLSALAAFGVGHVKFINWSKYKDLIIFVSCIIDGMLLFSMASTSSITLCYILYVIFTTTYQILITVASFEIAKKLDDDSFGLIFGINTFMALLLSTIVTSILINKGGPFQAPPRMQFKVYSGYFILMALMFGIYTFKQFISLCITKPVKLQNSMTLSYDDC